MTGDGRLLDRRRFLQVTAAGLAIFVTVLGFNLLGDGLKDELDPRTRRRRVG